MRETLLVRLGSEPQHPVMWMVWSESEQEVIASGELADADSLTTLSERVAGRRLIVLVPGSEVTVHQVALPEKAQKQALKALPFLVEEQVAEEIDQVHLTLLAKDQQSAQIMAVQSQRMAAWLQSLQRAELFPERMLPDWLALPCSEQQIHAVQLAEQWLFRSAAYAGFTLDAVHLNQWLPLLNPQPEAKPIIAHTPFVVDGMAVEQQLAELPLAALTKGALASSANLLQGRFALKRKQPQKFRVWRNLALLAGVTLLLYLTNGVIELNQLQAQKQAVQAQIVSSYQQAFPNEKRLKPSRIRAMLKQKLAAVGAEPGSQRSMLALLQQMLPALAQVNGFAISSIRYSRERNELRLQTMAASFEDYETLQKQLSKHFVTELGALNTVQSRVRGEIVLRSKG